MPAGQGEPPVPRAGAEHAVGQRLHLCRHLAGLRLRRLRHRRLRPPHRRLAGEPHGPCRASCSMLWNRPFISGSPERGPGAPLAIAGRNTCRSDTPSAWPRPASSPRSAASATATTMLWPRRSTVSYKAEVIHRRGPWRSFDAVEYATLEWVDWFNNRRLLEPIGNIPPAEAEANFYAALETETMAA